MRSDRRGNLFALLSLCCLCLSLLALPAMAQPLGCSAQPVCKATPPAASAEAQVEGLFGPKISIAGIPDPVLRAFIGDCCPGNNVANCPQVSGYFVRCDTPICETGERSCLYSPR